MQTVTIDESVSAQRRILFVAELAADTNEVQRIDLGDIGSGDTFTLTYSGQTTGSISYSATPATLASNIDTALEALSNIDASAVTVAHVSGALFDVTFGGNLAATDIALMTITPTGFTAGSITERQHGGIQGAPARGAVFADTDIQVSKNGGTSATSAGTVTEIGHGRYYYEATAGEVDTQGFLSLAVTREDIAVLFPTVQVVPASSALGAPVIRSGTAQAGASGSITLDSSASGTSTYYVPCLCYLRSGTGAGQARLAHAYNGSTKVLSIEPAWTTAPDSSTVFDLIPTTPLMADVLRANHATADTFGDVALPADIGDEIVPRIISDETAFLGADVAGIRADTEDLQARVPAALVSGRMSSDAVAISGSTTAADRLEAHTLAVLQVVIGAGSTASSIVLNATTGVNGGAPGGSNDVYNGRVLVLTSGTYAGQAQAITDYVGSTVTLTTGPFTGGPGAGDTGVIV